MLIQTSQSWCPAGPADQAGTLAMHKLTLRLEGPIGLPAPASWVHVHHNRLLVVREHGPQGEALLQAVALSAGAFANLHVHLCGQHHQPIGRAPLPWKAAFK